MRPHSTLPLPPSIPTPTLFPFWASHYSLLPHFACPLTLPVSCCIHHRCYDKLDCWGRSNGNLGSSTKWAPTSSMGGIMSDNCKTNPDFCNFNRVHMVYCDGNSFSGNRDDPLVVKGTDGKDKPLYFRGRR